MSFFDLMIIIIPVRKKKEEMPENNISSDECDQPADDYHLGLVNKCTILN
jgi:hypothetical protein